MTIDYVNTYLLLTKKPVRLGDAQDSVDGFEDTEMLERRGWLICASGLTLSVQSSKFHYCSPRSNTGPYSAVEVMIIEGEEPPTWTQYTNDIKGTSQVYTWIPVELVNQTIEDNGGIR